MPPSGSRARRTHILSTPWAFLGLRSVDRNLYIGMNIRLNMQTMQVVVDDVHIDVDLFVNGAHFTFYVGDDWDGFQHGVGWAL